MSAADTLIVRDGPVVAPLDYNQPAGSEIVPVCATASFDGTGAAGSFVPTLEIIAPDGHVVARCPIGSSIAAGASADVTWFPGVAAAPASSGAGSGPAVLFDTTTSGVVNSVDTGAGAIPATHKDLLIVTSIRTNEAIANNGQGALKFNADNTAGDYKTQTLHAISTTVSAATSTASTGMNVLMCAGASADANMYGSSWVYIPNYTSAHIKTAVALQGVLPAFASTAAWNTSILIAAWNGLTAISEIVFTPNIGGGGQFVAGCRFTVYGLG